MIKRKNDVHQNLHKFKKKKLNNLMENETNRDCINRLELLLSNKNNWSLIDLHNLFVIMYENFEIASVYGFQLEEALVAVVDRSTSAEMIQLAAVCMSRFANIKQTNGTAVIQMMTSNIQNTGIQLFDVLESPSNLSDIKLSFKMARNIFPTLNGKEDDNILWSLVNRIDFMTQTICFMFSTNSDISFEFPFDDIMKVSLSILSEYPKGVVNTSPHKLRHAIYFVHISIIKLLSAVNGVKGFRGCMFGYIRNIVEIVNGALGEVNGSGNEPSWTKDYLFLLVELMSQIAQFDGVNSLSTITTLVLPLIQSVLCTADPVQNTSSLKLICHILQYHHDSGVQKCVKACSGEIRQLMNFSLHKRSSRRLCPLTVNKLTKVVNMYTLAEEIVNQDYDQRIEETVMESEEMEDASQIMETRIDTKDLSEDEMNLDIRKENEEEAMKDIVENESTIEQIVMKMEVNEENNEETKIDLDLKEGTSDMNEEAKEETLEVMSTHPLTVEDMLKSFVPF